jgi:hypothetical protein
VSQPGTFEVTEKVTEAGGHGTHVPAADGGAARDGRGLDSERGAGDGDEAAASEDSDHAFDFRDEDD